MGKQGDLIGHVLMGRAGSRETTERYLHVFCVLEEIVSQIRQRVRNFYITFRFSQVTFLYQIKTEGVQC